MASRGVYVGGGDGRRERDSSGDEEEPDEPENGEREVLRIPTLRSMVVRVHSDEEEEEENDDGVKERQMRHDDRESSPPTAHASPLHRSDDDEEMNRVTNSPKQQRQTNNSSSRSEENRRRVDSRNHHRHSDHAYGSSYSQRGEQKERNSRGSEDDRGGNYRSGMERRDRDGDGGLDSRNRGRDGRRRVTGARIRDSDHGTALVSQRRDRSRSPGNHRIRDEDEGRLRRDRKRREIDRSHDEDEDEHDRNDAVDAEKYAGEEKRKGNRGSSGSPVRRGGLQEQNREKFRRQRERGGSRGQNHVLDRGGHHADSNSRGDRDASPSSADSRDAEARSRFPSAVDRSNRVGRNEVEWRKDTGRRDARDEGRGAWRRETDRGRDRGRGDTRDSTAPELYSIHKATVHSVRPFGVFVRMDGYRNHGLVHLSQLSDHEVTNRNDSDTAKVEAISSVVGEGEQVWIKVISVKIEDDGSVKVGCSLKYVSQGDGRDLDPNNLQLEKLQSKPPWQPPKKLELEAVYNVVCTRCGGHGHLKKECYSTGEKTYELLQDVDADDNGAGSSKPVAGVLPKNLAPAGGPSSKPPSGPAGRGRAMVQPAWMKHGVGVGGEQEKMLVGHSTKTIPGSPEKVSSVQEALAVLSKVKEEKRRRRDDRRHRKHRKREKKHSHKSQKDKHKRRHRSDDDHDHKSRKKPRS